VLVFFYFRIEEVIKLKILNPFGPKIAKIRLPDSLVQYLNKSYSDSLNIHQGFLVGKSSGEIDFTPEITKKVVDTLLPTIAEYHRALRPAHKKTAIEIVCHKGWYVRQMENEYVPAHVHPTCHLSCVGYLALPKGIEKEFDEDDKTISPRSGRIEFLYGDASMTYSEYSKVIKPEIGDFYLFPNGLIHTVYPFKTSGERRAFSMNLSVRIKEET
jgi:hypothetical protein